MIRELGALGATEPRMLVVAEPRYWNVIEWYEGGTETVPSVMSGSQQFGFSNVVTLLLAQAQGLPVKAQA